MTGFDIIVLIIVGVAAIGGFLRGFVQEILSLAAWALAIFAIHFLHSPLTAWLLGYVGSVSGAAVLAFTLLLLIPYAAMKLIAGRMGETTRTSILGPIDRVIGFAFGAIKGGVIVIAGFSLLVLGYDTVWGLQGRPDWIKTARTYQLVDAGSQALVQMIEQRRDQLRSDEAAAAE
ncbi:MAG: CvpA family protein [Alteripontixanthobacter sp.]